jgi:hypothetical protein
VITIDNVLAVFLETFPEREDQIRQAYADNLDDHGLITHGFVSEALDGPILMAELEDLSRPAGSELLIRGVALLERLLVEGDDLIRDAAETGTCEMIGLDTKEVWRRVRPLLGPAALNTCKGLRPSGLA